MDKPLKVLFLSSEVVPYAKTGGLADVAGALPLALKHRGVDVKLVMPFYRKIKEGNFDTAPVLETLEVPLGQETLKAGVSKIEVENGVPVYLIDREDLYDRPNLYGNADGDYYDNLERFSFFSHAALKIAESIAFQPDVIHCHDWQTGLVPALVKGPYKDSRLFSGIPSVFTIHNMGYQGIFPAEKLPLTALSGKDFFHIGGLEFWGKMSLLKAGIVYAEAITTVSPTYAKEIQTAEYGMGMEGILGQRRDAIFGILNGVDYGLWDPVHDTNLSVHYSPRDMAGKRLCKESLIREMGLEPSLVDAPLLGMISRLSAQKGLDLLVEILDDILDLDVGLVILGSGDKDIQNAILEATRSHPGRVGLEMGFNEPLAHQIMAGTDIFLIPSRYEPCGLTQMYALKYGTVPVVRATGGLDDTIVPFDSDKKEGNGLKFGPYKAAAFLGAIRTALDLFKNQRAWKRVRANGMRADFSWDRSARRYIEIYESVMKKKTDGMVSKARFYRRVDPGITGRNLSRR